MFHNKKKPQKPTKAPTAAPSSIVQAKLEISIGITNDRRIVFGVSPPSPMWFWDVETAESHANEILRIVRGIREGKTKDEIVQEGKK